MADPAIPQLSSVTSESLQATIRRLLPSQQGFGAELAATNVITPIIDLTPSAEGSSVPSFLQRAINFGGANTFEVANATTTIINNTGFYEITSNINFCEASSAIAASVKLNITDGATTKELMHNYFPDLASAAVNIPVNIVVFLNTGESLQIVSNSVQARHSGSFRQVADINGVLVNPVGFTPQ